MPVYGSPPITTFSRLEVVRDAGRCDVYAREFTRVGKDRWEQTGYRLVASDVGEGEDREIFLRIQQETRWEGFA